MEGPHLQGASEVFRGPYQAEEVQGGSAHCLEKKLLQALVLPHADYCAVAWHECTNELHAKVERILNYGMRLILSQPPRTPSGEMRRTLHWMPLERRRVMFRLILMHRCMNQLAPAYLTESIHRNCSLGYIRTRGSNNPHLFPD